MTQTPPLTGQCPYCGAHVEKLAYHSRYTLKNCQAVRILYVIDIPSHGLNDPGRTSSGRVVYATGKFTDIDHLTFRTLTLPVFFHRRRLTRNKAGRYSSVSGPFIFAQGS
jgi:hypothetical protein